MSDTNQAGETHTTSDGHEHLAHPVSVKFMVAILLVLLVLTGVTYAVSYVDLGQTGNLFLAMAVATVKGLLVALFFMHLRWDKPFNGLIIVTSFVALGLFIFFTKLDTAEYMHEIAPMLENPAQQIQFERAAE